jgi:nicotinamidase-related amidase
MELHNKKQNAALVVMDVQDATVKMLGDASPLMKSLTVAMQKARKNKIPVIYAVIGFRKGYPEASANNKSFSMIKTGTMNFETEEAARVHAAVAPQPGEIIVTKKRVSAFTGSDLEVVLRSMEINHLVLSGIATSGVVLSTLREAADKDYRITVLSDCCADRDEEVHRVLTAKVFPRQAEVTTSGEWLID